MDNPPESGAALSEETPLDPDRAIVDCHHHLWDHARVPPTDFMTFLLPEMLHAIHDSGHKITHTVYMECGAMYRQDGPEEYKSVGEVEFVNGVAAMSASGRYGAARVAAGIIGRADLTRGEHATPVLEALIAAGNGRFRGIRPWVAYSDQGLLGLPPDTYAKGVMTGASFREGVRVLGRLGLLLELWCLRTQLAEAAEFASACPDTIIVLNHLASPHFRNPSRDDLGQWRTGIIELARRPNVRLKLGGIGTNVDGAVDFRRHYKPSEQLASAWKDYIETGIAAFGPERCMFESNYPPDGTTASYGALWNAFKRITKDYSEGEKALMFGGVAKSVYRLN